MHVEFQLTLLQPMLDQSTYLVEGMTTQGSPSVGTDLPPQFHWWPLRWPRQFLRWPPVAHSWGSVATGGQSMKGPQRLVTLVETAGKFYKHMHALIIFDKVWKVVTSKIISKVVQNEAKTNSLKTVLDIYRYPSENHIRTSQNSFF